MAIPAKYHVGGMVERAMAPLSRRLGWHPDFALRDLLDPAATPVDSIEPCPPAGISALTFGANRTNCR